MPIGSSWTGKKPNNAAKNNGDASKAGDSIAKSGSKYIDYNMENKVDRDIDEIENLSDKFQEKVKDLFLLPLSFTQPLKYE
jgi:hypothetical protein